MGAEAGDCAGEFTYWGNVLLCSNPYTGGVGVDPIRVQSAGAGAEDCNGEAADWGNPQLLGRSIPGGVGIESGPG